MKTTECWTVEGGDGAPVLHWVFDKKDSYHPGAAVLMWKSDLESLLKELSEYKALIKTCHRCESRDFHEFIRGGNDGFDYCESCWDHMFVEWGKKP